MPGWTSNTSLPAAFAALIALTVIAIGAGEINPPSAPGPSMPPLEEIRWVAEPRTPIAELPFVIAEPGSYVVMGNLTGNAVSPGIIIEVSDVTIDLNGFTLTGGAMPLDGIAVQSGGPTLQGIAIRNGALRGWGADGIALGSSTGCLIESVRIEDVQGAGIAAGTDTTVRDCTVLNATSYGIVVDDVSTVIGCIADGCATGISADSGSALRDCVAMNSVSNGYGIGGSCTVIGCTARSNGTDGFNIYTDSNIVNCASTYNGAGGLGGRGFALNPGCLIQDCVASNNQSDGILLTGRCTAIGNLCDNNMATGGTGVGIHSYFASAADRIEGNTVTNNDTGIWVQNAGNIIIGNRLTGNTTTHTITTGNAVGPWVNVAGQADLSTVTNAGHPTANLVY